MRTGPWVLVLLLGGLPAAAEAQGVSCEAAPWSTTRTGRTYVVQRAPTGRTVRLQPARRTGRAWRVERRDGGRTSTAPRWDTGRRATCPPAPTGRAWSVVQTPAGRTRVAFSHDTGRTWTVTTDGTGREARLRAYRSTGRTWVIERRAVDTGRTDVVTVQTTGRSSDAPPFSRARAAEPPPTLSDRQRVERGRGGPWGGGAPPRTTQARTLAPTEVDTGRTSTPTRPARTGRTRGPRAWVSREAPVEPTPRYQAQPVSDDRLLPADVLGRTLLQALEERDLLRACRLAAQAEGDPETELAVQAALFAQLPSPGFLEEVAERIAADPACADAPGSGMLLRLLGTAAASPAPR